MSIFRTCTIIVAASLLALTLIGCSKQDEPVPVKATQTDTANAMLNSPNLTAEQKAKIQEGMKTHGDGATTAAPDSGTK